MNIGIVGFGKMGSGIFNLLSRLPFEITVWTRFENNIHSIQQKFIRKTGRSLKRGAITEKEYEVKINSVRFTNQWEHLAQCDIVIESAAESLAIKQMIFNVLKTVVGPNTIFTTNTSSLSIKQITQQTGLKSRLCGLHFFHPVAFIDLVEIIVTDDTPPEVESALKSLCKTIGKHSIVVKDAPGSLMNIILSSMYMEALYILEEGLALPSHVDELARKYFYIGPCESLDVIGIDFYIKAVENVLSVNNHLISQDIKSYPEKKTSKIKSESSVFPIPYLLKKLIAENRLGKKVNQGLYLYEGGRMADDNGKFYLNPDISPLTEVQQNHDEIISRRLLFSIFKGALYGLEQQLATYEDINSGLGHLLQMACGPFEMIRRMDKEKAIAGVEFFSKRLNSCLQQISPLYAKQSLLKEKPESILKRSQQKIKNLKAYRCLIETITKNSSEIKANYRYLYQTPGNIRIETIGPSQRGSVLVVLHNGKITARPGGLLAFMKVELTPDSPYLKGITGESAIESSWLHLFAEAEKMTPYVTASRATLVEYKSRQAYEIDTWLEGAAYDRIRMIIDKDGPVLYIEHFVANQLKRSVRWEQIEINPPIAKDSFEV
jgi:3-hydroxybutyryl-CoA dehydrogenase